MVKGDRGLALRDLDTLFSVGVIGGLTDAQLLERFTARRDETAELAFRVLVERHGPMVLRACRSILSDPHDAHDAFQATFLVLVRRASSLWVRDSLGSWLLQVAHRTASCARSAAARRRRHEGRAAELTTRSADESDRDDLGGLVYTEVFRLPVRYRAAVVLCLLEGLTPEQAARQLGCPVGTVHSRLARGREQLRARLTRHGLAVSAGLSALGWARDGVSAAVPTALTDATIRTALPLAAGVVEGSVTGLAGMTLRSMLMAKIRVAVAAFGVLAVGAGVLARQEPGDRSPPEANREKKTVEPDTSPKVTKARGDWSNLAGRWEVIAIEDSGRKVEPVEAGFNECRALAPKPEAKSGTGSVGWLILSLNGRMYTEWHVTKLDHTAEPGMLDFNTARDMTAGAKGEIARSPIHHKAIYRLKGDELTVCLGRGVRDGQPDRPSDFASEVGSGRMLIKFRRRS